MVALNPIGELILQQLQLVAQERERRVSDASLARRVAWVKAFQQHRFRRTYADLLVDPRYRAAAEFFLNDLYGPADFSQRDQQFARVVPALVRLFPKELLQTVESLAHLHALSERLDSDMGSALDRLPADDPRGMPPSGASEAALLYAKAWRDVGSAADRETQIALMLRIGSALDQYTRKVMLRQSLRLMRGPAQVAGLASLQTFLEAGFDTFRNMRGAESFLATIGHRERSLAADLFAGRDQMLTSDSKSD